MNAIYRTIFTPIPAEYIPILAIFGPEMIYYSAQYKHQQAPHYASSVTSTKLAQVFNIIKIFIA